MTTVQDLGFAPREEIHWEIECSSDFCYLELDYRDLWFDSADDAEAFIRCWLTRFGSGTLRSRDKYNVNHATLSESEESALLPGGYSFEFRLGNETLITSSENAVTVSRRVEVQAVRNAVEREQIEVNGKTFQREDKVKTIVWPWRPLVEQERDVWGHCTSKQVVEERHFYIVKHTNTKLCGIATP
jgi:hypothetical protein